MSDGCRDEPIDRAGWQDLSPGTTWGSYCKLRKEIDRLQAIVALLPKTADGVPITPGMRLWYSNAAGEVGRTDPLELGDHESSLADYEVNVYATEAGAAAEAAEVTV